MPGAQMTCGSCRKAVPLSDVKYMPKGDSQVALCGDCRAKMKEKSERKIPAAAAKTDKKPYFCVRCKYKFKWRPTASTLLVCPYCGKGDKLIEDIAPAADKLIRELDLE